MGNSVSRGDSASKIEKGTQMSTKTFIFVLVAALFWGIAPIFGKLGLAKPDPTVALVFRSFVVSLILLIWAVVTTNIGQVVSLAISKSGMLIAAEGIMASLLAQLAYYYVLKSGDVSKVVPVTSSFPLVAMILAVLVLGEKLSLTRVIGALLILEGIILIKM